GGCGRPPCVSLVGVSGVCVCVFIISVDRTYRLTDENTLVSVRLKTQSTPIYNELGPREGAAWGRLNYPSDQRQKRRQQKKSAAVYVCVFECELASRTSLYRCLENRVAWNCVCGVRKLSGAVKKCWLLDDEIDLERGCACGDFPTVSFWMETDVAYTSSVIVGML
ncbi:unnamed protein product, partial [Ectocarpus sp. 12 AP-2014]